MLTFEELMIPGLRLVSGRRFADGRGDFEETYRESAFQEAGIGEHWVQENHAYTLGVHVLRGLHFQAPPHAQAKLVRVAAGRILDVAVDLRRSSPTFGRHAAVELSRGNGRQLLIPAGFAHGYLTLEPHCHVLYKVSSYYARDHEGGLHWGDETLAIDWLAPKAEIRTNEKDQAWPSLADLVTPFD